jgi:hypothetical protein
MANAVVVYCRLAAALALACGLALGEGVLVHDASTTASTTPGTIRLAALCMALSDELAS